MRRKNLQSYQNNHLIYLRNSNLSLYNNRKLAGKKWIKKKFFECQPVFDAVKMKKEPLFCSYSFLTAIKEMFINTSRLQTSMWNISNTEKPAMEKYSLYYKWKKFQSFLFSFVSYFLRLNREMYSVRVVCEYFWSNFIP